MELIPFEEVINRNYNETYLSTITTVDASIVMLCRLWGVQSGPIVDHNERICIH